MNQEEKIQLLQDTIKQLRVYECKSFNYISQLLKLDRKKLTAKIREWGYEPRSDKRGIKPSTQKFLNENKQRIISAYNNNTPMTEIVKQLGTTESMMQSLNKYDDDIKKAFSAMKDRKQQVADTKKETEKENSYHDYNVQYFEDEIWTKILGYDDYEVSNHGRIRKYVKSYNSYYLISPQKNSLNGRLYVALCESNKKANLQVARLTAFAYCTGFDDKHNTVNHKDGNVENNKADNLEWVSQSENNRHSYKELHRTVNYGKPIDYRIKYKGKYEFKTVAAFARFIEKSETQTRRYISDAKNHDIELIQK